MSVVIVDWLGRGGIAQTSESWAIELSAAGVQVDVVTRPGRELGTGDVKVHGGPDVRGRLGAHRAVARTAGRFILETKPDVVVVQNYVLPVLEGPVYAAARQVGARVVVVVHDHRLHTWRAGTHFGMAERVRDADVVVTHSEFVADGVRSMSGRRDVITIRHPVQVGVLSHSREAFDLPQVGESTRWAGHFGVLRRSYKGGDLVEQLAACGAPGWQLFAMGTGAVSSTGGLHVVEGYAPPGLLTAAVAQTDVTLVPYTHATQSGVVVLAHALGSVPIAAAVGGIPEQIDDGVDGILIPPDADVYAWRTALAALSDDAFRKDLAVAGTERAWRDHDAFVDAIKEVIR